MDSRIVPVGSLGTSEVRTVLTAATAAPSLHNSQPWRFQCTPAAIQLYADRDRALPAADPDQRELLLACGAALFNLRISIRALGVHPAVTVLPDADDPDLLATIRPHCRRPSTPTERELAAAIPRRHTNRHPFAAVEVPTPVRHQLRRAAELERAWLATVHEHQLPAMRELVHRAHAIQTQDSAFLSEWRLWTGRGPDTADGVTVCSSGPLPELQDEWVLRDFSGGQAIPRAAGKDFEPSPLIAVVGSFHDLPAARIQAGQAMQRVLLRATASGLSASFLSQVVEVPQTRRELRALIGGGLWPQAALRLGYGSPVAASPRRQLDEVVMGEQMPLRR